jgi:hypothetical protein
MNFFPYQMCLWLQVELQRCIAWSRDLRHLHPHPGKYIFLSFLAANSTAQLGLTSNVKAFLINIRCQMMKLSNI